MDEDFCGSALWESNVTELNATFPDVTQCFRVTVLVWVPCGYLFVVTPFYLWFLSILSKKDSIQHSWLNVTKTVLCTLLSVFALVDVAYRIIEFLAFHNPHPAHVLAPFLTCLAMGTVLLLTQLGRTRGVRVAGVLFLYWLIQFVCALIILQSEIRKSLSLSKDSGRYHLTYSCIFALLVSIELVLYGCFVDNAGQLSKQKLSLNSCPENSACFVSVLLFWWFTRLIVLGYKRPLTKCDLWSLNPQDASISVVPHFETFWNCELQKAARKSNEDEILSQDDFGSITLKRMTDKDVDTRASLTTEAAIRTKSYAPRLWLSLVRSFWQTFMFSAFLKLIHDILLFVSPVLLKAMISFVDDPTEPAWHGYAYAVLMFIVAFVESMILNQYFHRCMIVGMRIRTVLVASIYKKSLLLSNAARRKSTVGEIVNLMSVDVQHFMELTAYLNMLWSAPFQMCVCLYFLWKLLGPSVLAGVAVMVVMIPINAIIAKKAQQLQVMQMEHKDARLKLMNEVLNGVKVLKLYAWELSFQQKIMKVRKDELLVLRKFAYLNAASSFTWTCAPFLVSLTTFAVYVLSSEHNVLDAQKAFVALSLFNILRFPLSMLPMLIANMVQTTVSLRRLQSFLTNEELEPTNVDRKPDIGDAILVENGTFSWEKLDEKPTLENISLRVRPGSFVGIVGQVGCGKSTLLSAILGETVRQHGSVSVKGSVAYVAQQAWIQNAALEDNILFQKIKNDEFYEKIIYACELQEDLKILPAGDQTEIGEKGINLSGGQKQRVALARAVYFDADVYLLDDPLSAVDSRVGKHIFDRVLSRNGLLQNKTRLLVTHGISYLSQLDMVVVMVDGQISEMGTYKELLSRNSDFAEFLRTYLDNEDVDKISEIDNEEIQLREEILSHIGSSTDIRRSMERLYRLRRDTLKSSEGDAAVAAENPDISPVQSSFSDSGLINHQSDTERTKSDAERTRSASDSEGIHVGMKSPSRRKTGEAEKENGETRQLLADTDLESRKDAEGSSILNAKISQNCSGSVKSVTLSKVDSKIAAENKDNEKSKLIEEEKAETGRVKFAIFLAYFKSIGIIVSLGILFLYVVNNAMAVYADFWLSEWSNDKAVNGTIDTKLRDLRLGIYGLLGLGQGLFEILCAFATAMGCITGSRKLYCALVFRLLRAPSLFHERTPKGRVLSRLSEDTSTVDRILPFTVRSIVKTLLAAAVVVIVIALTSVLFLASLPPLVIIYLLVQRFYVATSRQLRRLESISRSPVYSHFTETLQGVATIRAFDQQERFINESKLKLDENQETYYPGIVSHRWLAVRLEFVGNCLVLFAAIFAAVGRDHLSPGIVGLSITYALNITQTLNWMVRMSSELETNIVAVERIKEYSEIETEADWVREDNRPEPSWPSEGSVKFRNYFTRYRKELDPILRDITCDIRGGEKIGIVGRTGAGKSSLALALFRIIEPSSGTIFIDDVDISQIGLHDLRSKITIIPQDPVIFSGTLRMNLDPFDKYSDDEIWCALNYAHLKSYIATLPDELQHECSEGGENLSVGHRQLICLARAILRKSKILVLDEATSSVDLETDSLIQSTIREQFSESTVLTIAHRLNTIMDYTRVMVLDVGEIREFDSPQTLLLNRDSLFYKMAADAKLTAKGDDEQD